MTDQRANRRAMPAARSARLRTLAALGLAVASWLLAPAAGSASVKEDQVKAAFLLNFTRFVGWPDSSFDAASAPFVICVLDDSGFAATASDVIGSRTVGSRSVSVSARPSVEAAAGCHILYLPASQKALQPRVIEVLAAESVFTVSDSDGFAAMGGMANFKRAGSKLGLEINRTAAGKANLKVNARLLRIADVVG